MLIFRAYNASPGSLAGRRNVSSEMALSNDEYAICSVLSPDTVPVIVKFEFTIRLFTELPNGCKYKWIFREMMRMWCADSC